MKSKKTTDKIPLTPQASSQNELVLPNAKAVQSVKRSADGTMVVSPSKSLNELLLTICESSGTKNVEVSARIVEQVANSLLGIAKDLDTRSLIAIRSLEEMEPRNLTEATLAAQMIATHEAGLFFMRRATVEGQTFEGADANVLRATRLLRLHLEQLEAMQKLKGKAGQQKVTVEHVHVHQGGQAIVGALSTSSKPGREGVNDENLGDTP